MFTVILIILVFCTIIYIIYYSIANPGWPGHESTLFTGIMYLTLGLSFAIVSIGIIHQLRTHFTDFYVQIKFKLIMVSIGLTFPLLLRGSIDTISGSSIIEGTEYDKWTSKYEYYYNIFILFFCNWDLICF